MRVLVVDDDPESRAELSGLLRNSGHSAHAVSSAVAATRALSREEYDVMFSDVRMGRRGAVDLLQSARAEFPRMFVVMLTGNATVEAAVHALQLGAFDYLRKPATSADVARVLALVGQQLALTRAGGSPADPVRFASELAVQGGFEVLLVAPPPSPRDPRNVRYLPLDPGDPSRIRSEVEAFAAGRERAGVVLAAVELLLEHHRMEDVAVMLEGIRSALAGKGPLAVGYDPDRITAGGALTVRASIVAADAHLTLESLSSPIRRMVLRRLAEGPATFTKAMEAAHVEDTSLIAFHLRKLSESGLVAHVARERYRLTPRGRGAVRILDSIHELDSARGSGNRIFPSTRSKPTSR